jgi:hypothetical protein
MRLKDRVEELESLLKQERQKNNYHGGREAPELAASSDDRNHFPKGSTSSTCQTSRTGELSPEGLRSDVVGGKPSTAQPGEQPSASEGVAESDPDRPSPISSTSSSKGIVDRLLDPVGQLTIDHGTGRLRYFGPTTNLHTFWDVNVSTDVGQRRENNQITTAVLRNLSVETHDYLMYCFWTYHNTIFHIVHKEKDKESERGNNYSGLLHICILAMGFRFSDKSKPSIQKLALPDCPRESLLHQEAKRLFEHELKHPGGIPSIQALLLLADLECASGRDNTGWMYAGMHNSVTFEGIYNIQRRY